MVNRLLELQVDTSAQTKDGWQPIHAAAEGGHLEVVNHLLELQVDASAQSKDGLQPIHSAAVGGHLEVVNRLLELQVDPSAQTKDGSQPIHMAAVGGHLEVLNRLLELQVDASYVQTVQLDSNDHLIKHTPFANLRRLQAQVSKKIAAMEKKERNKHTTIEQSQQTTLKEESRQAHYGDKPRIETQKLHRDVRYYSSSAQQTQHLRRTAAKENLSSLSGLGDKARRLITRIQGLFR